MNYHVFNSRSVRQGSIESSEHWQKVYKNFPVIVKRLQQGKEQFDIKFEDFSLCFRKTECDQRPKCNCGNDILIQQEIFRYKTQGGYIKEIYKCLECQSTQNLT